MSEQATQSSSSLQDGATSATTSHETDVQVLDQPGMRCVPFAVTLSSSTLEALDEPQTSARKVSALVGNNGVVGTILFLKNSIIVWVGWGKIDSKTTNSTNEATAKTTVVGSGTYLQILF